MNNNKLSPEAEVAMQYLRDQLAMIRKQLDPECEVPDKLINTKWCEIFPVQDDPCGSEDWYNQNTIGALYRHPQLSTIQELCNRISFGYLKRHLLSKRRGIFYPGKLPRDANAQLIEQGLEELITRELLTIEKTDLGNTYYHPKFE